MTCDESKDQLAAFHFGELELHKRTQLEEHVTTCLHCVRELIELKRDVELCEGGPRPSGEARRDLREAVAAELGLRWNWWERPVAFFLAATSVVLAVFLVQH